MSFEQIPPFLDLTPAVRLQCNFIFSKKLRVEKSKCLLIVQTITEKQRTQGFLHTKHTSQLGQKNVSNTPPTVAKPNATQKIEHKLS